jgi:hypothetical protein
MSKLLGLALVSIAGVATFAGAQPNESDFPLNIRVISFSKHLPESSNSTTNCEDTSIPGYEKTVQCRTVGLEGYEKDLQLQIGNTTYSARCLHCGNSRRGIIGVGEYRGRWKMKDVELEILSADEKGKPRTAVYRVLSAIAAAPTRAAEVTASPCTTGATLEISSIPTGAEITIDGQFVGSTPSSLQLLAGNHEITMQKKGFKNWARTAQVLSGKITVVGELEKLQ